MGKQEGTRSRRSGVAGSLLFLPFLLLAGFGFQAPQDEPPPTDPPPEGPPPVEATLQGQGDVATEEAAVPEGETPPDLPRPDANLLLWHAGRAPLVGLPAARAAGREDERTAALEELARELDGDSPGAAPWAAHLATLLAASDHGVDSWCEAARVAGDLRRYELAPALLDGLGDEARPRRHEAAAYGLHALYGRWFASREEAAPFLAHVRPGAGTSLLLDGALARENEANAHLLRALGHEPDKAPAHLASSDPRVRAGAARILGEAVAAQTLPPATALAALLPRLEVERDAAAFEAALASTLALVARTAPDAPEVVRLRGILRRLVPDAPDERSLSVVRGLARLPWSMEPPPDTPGALSAVAWIGWILDAQRDAEARRGAADPDAILATLDALRMLCDRVEGDRPRQDLHRNGARVPIFQILQDPARTLDERVAAVGLLGHFALEEDAERITTVLDESPTERALSHALLGALRSILPRFRTEDEETAELLRTVARLAGSDDPDLRRRSLALLEDEGLVDHTAGLDPMFLVERLGAEEIPDLQGALLGLVERFGRPEMLDPLLQLASFDRLASGDLERLAKLAGALGRLAGDRPLYRMAVAKRLVAVADDATRLFRIQSAITLVAAFPPDVAAQLGTAENDCIGAWAWELHAAGVPLDTLPGGAELRTRMVEVHLADRPPETAPNGAAPVFPEAARQHLLGVYRGELGAVSETPSDPGPAEAAFARALELAPAHPDPGFAGLVRRDRARFRGARGDRVAALDDYRALVDSGVLELSDLRHAVAWIAALAGADPAASAEAAAAERYGLLDRLVRRSSWRNEPAAVRMEDLRQLSACAHTGPAALRPDRLARFAAIFADLPAERPPNGHDVEHPPLWVGLARDDASFAELGALRDQARAALPPGPGEDETPDDPPAEVPPPDKGGEGGGGGA